MENMERKEGKEGRKGTERNFGKSALLEEGGRLCWERGGGERRWEEGKGNPGDGGRQKGRKRRNSLSGI